jgi:hypothetical protein
MLRSLIRLLVFVCLGSCLMPAILGFPARLQSGLSLSPHFLVESALLVCAAVILTVTFYYVLKRLGPFIDANALEQAEFLDRFDPKYVDVAILVSAALSLFLELAIIRWQSTVFEFFAFNKNFSLLRACYSRPHSPPAFDPVAGLAVRVHDGRPVWLG